MLASSRPLRLIREFKERLDLNLVGMSVLTEAGSGPFVYSPVIAAISGAERVEVVAPSSAYARHEEIRDRLYALCDAARVSRSKLRVVSERAHLDGPSDIILNLGFVRPIDELVLRTASERAVLSYMCEAWEYRPGDLDLDLCAARNIPVAGTNENFSGMAVFDSCGQLALKLLFEAGLEVAGCTIAILSDDPFGPVMHQALTANGASCVLYHQGAEISLEEIPRFDALLLADYSGRPDLFEGSVITPDVLRAHNPSIKVVQLLGAFDASGLRSAGIACYPEGSPAGPWRMSRTLGYLGERPVIALHALGLKVGELLFRQKNFGQPPGDFTELLQPLKTH